MKLSSVLLSLACLASGLRAEDSCGGTFRGFQYTITSPNYPGNYPSRTECTYRLEAEPSTRCEQQFHLQFLDFNLKPSEGCRGDHLRVGDKNVYCGNTLGLRKFTGINNTLTLTFHSDQTGRTAKGFKILVSALPCDLKLSPLKNPPLADGRSSLRTRGIGGGTTAAYRRGIRGGSESEVDNAATRLNLLTSDVGPSIRRPQTANPAISGDSAPRITSYLFLPPKEDGANVTVHYDLGSALDDRDSTPPPNDLRPPGAGALSAFSALDKKSGGVPARSYGEPGALDYDAAPLCSDCDKSSQVLTGGSFDGANFGPRYGSSGNLVYDPKYGLVGGSGYPSSGYYPPNAGYPGSSYAPDAGYPGTSYPNYPQEYPGGFGSGYPNGANGYPGYDPAGPSYSPSIGGGFVGSGGGGFAGPGGGGECCRLPTSARYSIVSPGFPASALASGGGYSCRYTIVKSSPDVCRLRLNLRFFNFGADDPYCSLGYVDVDGQRFCGCRSGQNLQLLFGDYIAKTITVFSAGASRSRPAGFLIDVAQESCLQPGLPGYSPGYNPGYSPGYNPGYSPGYNPGYNPGYSGYLRRRSADNSSDIAPSPPDPNPHVRRRRDTGYSYARPSVPFPGAGQERFFGGSCQSRLLLDWAVASKEALLRGARCSTTGYGFGARRSRSLEDDDESCEEIGETRGQIRSPLYPSAYPGNASKCYRFTRAANVCALELHVRDFDLEPSQDCAKDYLSFGPERKKYCGEALNDVTTLFDLTHASSLRVDFASDELGAGRGFDIDFAQLPCEPRPDV